MVGCHALGVLSWNHPANQVRGSGPGGVSPKVIRPEPPRSGRRGAGTGVIHPKPSGILSVQVSEPALAWGSFLEPCPLSRPSQSRHQRHNISERKGATGDRRAAGIRLFGRATGRLYRDARPGAPADCRSATFTAAEAGSASRTKVVRRLARAGCLTVTVGLVTQL